MCYPPTTTQVHTPQPAFPYFHLAKAFDFEVAFVCPRALTRPNSSELREPVPKTKTKNSL